MSDNPFAGMLASPAMERLFEAPRVLAAMLEFEAALARAEAEAGVIPAAAATTIVACCRSGAFDPEALVAASRRAGSLAIPLEIGRAHV